MLIHIVYKFIALLIVINHMEYNFYFIYIYIYIIFELIIICENDLH